MNSQNDKAWQYNEAMADQISVLCEPLSLIFTSISRYRTLEPLPSLLMVTNDLFESRWHSNDTRAFWATHTNQKFQYVSFLGNHIATNENIASLLDNFINFSKGAYEVTSIKPRRVD